MIPDPSINCVDTHCHLNFDLFDNDRNLVVDRARDHGVTRILIPGIDIDTSKSAIILAHTYSEIYAAVGIHPNQGSEWTDDTLTELRKLTGDRKVKAIGEIGLDYFHNHLPQKLQKEIFKKQLDLAAELNLPVIIHNRDSSNDLIEIIQVWYQELCRRGLELANRPGVLHSFSSNKELANAAFSMHFKIGIGGPITFKNTGNLQSLISVIDLEHILVETDAPFLSPHPFRGKRNEPANVRIVVERIADIKEISIDKVATVTSATADKIFRWRESH